MSQAIELKEYLVSLRRNLLEAAIEGEGQGIRFVAEAITLELEVQAQKNSERGGDLNFKVFGVGFGGKAGAAASEGSTQSLTQKCR